MLTILLPEFVGELFESVKLMLNCNLFPFPEYVIPENFIVLPETLPAASVVALAVLAVPVVEVVPVVLVAVLAAPAVPAVLEPVAGPAVLVAVAAAPAVLVPVAVAVVAPEPEILLS